MNAIFRRLGVAAALLVIAAYAMVVLRGPNGLTALAARRQAIRELQEKNATLEAENSRKRERIELLKHNPETQDYEIREKLKLVRPGEEQVILDGEAPKPAAPAPASAR